MNRPRHLSIIALALFLATSAPTAAQVCGDVGGDGKVTTADALAVLKKAVGVDVGLTCKRYQPATVTPIPGGFQIVDSWISSGGRNRESFRNQHFVFNVVDGGDVTFKVASNVSEYLYVIDSLGIVVAETSLNSFFVNLAPGEYTLVAATYNTGEASSYVMSILGSVEFAGKVESQRVTKVGTWESSGGRSRSSFRNIHYDFDVANDSYMDITIQTSVSEYLYLVDPLGFVVAEGSGNRIVSPVSPGTYRLVVATYDPAQSANFVVALTGQFENTVEKTSKRVEVIGSWISSGGRNRNSSANPRYAFDVFESSLVDITVESSVSNYLYLVDSLNNVVVETSEDRLTAQVAPGQYQLVAATYSTGQASNFRLKFYGLLDNVQLQQ